MFSNKINRYVIGVFLVDYLMYLHFLMKYYFGKHIPATSIFAPCREVMFPYSCKGSLLLLITY